MNIEFSFKNEPDSGKMMAFYSTNFPENINFKVGDLIWISSFTKFLKKGRLNCPDKDVVYAELGEESGICEVLSFYHEFIEGMGYAVILEVECN